MKISKATKRLHELYLAMWINNYISEDDMVATHAAYENNEEAKEMTFREYVEEFGFSDDASTCYTVLKDFAKDTAKGSTEPHKCIAIHVLKKSPILSVMPQLSWAYPALDFIIDFSDDLCQVIAENTGFFDDTMYETIEEARKDGKDIKFEATINRSKRVWFTLNYGGCFYDVNIDKAENDLLYKFFDELCREKLGKSIMNCIDS
jgi:hypothetical protein